MHYPKLTVRVPEQGVAILTTVLIDGVQWPVTRVAFDTGEDLNGLVKIKLEFHGSIDMEAETPLAVTAIDHV